MKTSSQKVPPGQSRRCSLPPSGRARATRRPSSRRAPPMATLTIAAAARLCGCPRSTLQRAIRAGRLRLDANHQLETDDLTRAGYLTAAAAPQSHAPAAPQSRQDMEDLLRSMQRTMERLTADIEVLS